MKLNILGFLFLSLVIATSCSLIKGKKKGVSSTTGMAYNDPKNGGFEYRSGYIPKAGPGLIYIQGGTFAMGRVEQDVMYEGNNIPRRVTVASFFMDETEVRNVDWREYLFWLQRVYPDDKVIFKDALPDTLVWHEELAFNEPYVENYFRHAAFAEYPVVGVSWLQAQRYCSWRTDRANEAILVDQGILQADTASKNDSVFTSDSYLNNVYTGKDGKRPIKNINKAKGNRRVNISDGIMLPKYRLPTEAEWEYAALGLIGKTDEETVLERRIYPWDGNQVRNSNKKKRGEMMSNNVRGRGDYMGTAGNLNDKYEITAPVKSFEPNDYGLYDMAGNVNEWVQDVYRPSSSLDINEFQPFRGNVYTNFKRDKDGKPLVNKYGELILDTAKNGNLINFRDGDPQTKIVQSEEEWKKLASEDSTNQMYEKGIGNGRARFSDHTRVYKGGSWKDRVYWLGPGTRRYLDEDKRTDDLGFRCAMTHLGASNLSK